MSSSVLIALGSNLGDRARFLRRAVHELSPFVTIVRMSRVRETEPVGAPPGSPRFFNMVVAGYTQLGPETLLGALQSIEHRLGRRRGVKNAPRTIDLDLILHSAHLRRSERLVLPHPRYREREFVLTPLRELRLSWVDPVTRIPISSRRCPVRIASRDESPRTEG